MKTLQVDLKKQYPSVLLNIIYAHKSKKDLHLHIIIPALKKEQQLFPLIMWVQGSAFHKQNLSLHLPQMIKVAQQGYVVAMATMVLNSEILKTRKSYLLTQSRSYTMPELGKIMTKVTGYEIGYHPVTVEEFGEIYASEGDGHELASMYAGGAKGYLHGLSDDFAHITGHEPETIEHFLMRKYQK